MCRTRRSVSVRARRDGAGGEDRLCRPQELQRAGAGEQEHVGQAFSGTSAAASTARIFSSSASAESSGATTTRVASSDGWNASANVVRSAGRCESSSPWATTQKPRTSSCSTGSLRREPVAASAGARRALPRPSGGRPAPFRPTDRGRARAPAAAPRPRGRPVAARARAGPREGGELAVPGGHFEAVRRKVSCRRRRFGRLELDAPVAQSRLESGAGSLEVREDPAAHPELCAPVRREP